MRLNAADPDCVKLRPKNGGWLMDGHLKPTKFVGGPTHLQVDDILQLTQ